MSLFMVRKDLNKNRYTSAQEFIRDIAQITWNCRLFNRKNSIFYKYALILDDYLHTTVEKLKALNKFKKERLEYPDLGELPDNDDEEEEEEIVNEENVEEEPSKRKRSGRPKKRSPEEEEDDEDEEEDGEDEEEDEEEEDEEDEDEDEDDDDEDDDGTGRKRKTRTYLKRSSKKKKAEETSATSTPAPEDRRKKRGRPPTVDKPHEHRIKAIMRGVRKVKDENTKRMLHLDFEKLPDPKQNPDYYHVIKTPLGMDSIRKNIKRRKYGTVELYLNDMKQMFANARAYNGPQSQMGLDADKLEARMVRLAKEEMSKPDSIYQDPESNSKISRLPLDSIEHNGVVYRVGDWIHIKNPNNPKVPTVGQIFRIWRDANKQQWINACWYYRPEQTVHRYDKLFFDNEVVKSGQYRDHRVDEIVEKCFVMFFTKYQRGRPKGIGNASVYCCESRYNESEKTFNKIRTWKACIPDEVRSTDYPMDLFDRVVPLRRVESPIKKLLPANARDNDPIPEPTMGAPNAPPALGAVYRRPYDPDDPPEVPTPANAETPRIVPTPSISNNSNRGSHQQQQYSSHQSHHNPKTPSVSSNTNNLSSQHQTPVQQSRGQLHSQQQPGAQHYVLTNGIRYQPVQKLNPKTNSQVVQQMALGANGVPIPLSVSLGPGTPTTRLQPPFQQAGYSAQKLQQKFGTKSSVNGTDNEGPMMGQLMPDASYLQQHPHIGFNPQAAAPPALPSHLTEVSKPGESIPAATAVSQHVVPPAGVTNNYIPTTPSQQSTVQKRQAIAQGMNPVAPGAMPVPGPPNPVSYIQMPLGATPGAVYNPQQFAQAGITPPPSGPVVVSPIGTLFQQGLSPAALPIVTPPHLKQDQPKGKAEGGEIPVQLQHIPRQQYPQFAQQQARLQQQHLQQQLQSQQAQTIQRQQGPLQQQLHVQLQQYQQQQQRGSSLTPAVPTDGGADALSGGIPSVLNDGTALASPSTGLVAAAGGVAANIPNSLAAVGGNAGSIVVNGIEIPSSMLGGVSPPASVGGGGGGLIPASTPGVVPTTSTTIAMTTKGGQMVIPTAVAIPETTATSENAGMTIIHPAEEPLAKVTTVKREERGNGEAKTAKKAGTEEVVAWFPTPPVFIAKRHVCEVVGRNVTGMIFGPGENQGVDTGNDNITSLSNDGGEYRKAKLEDEQRNSTVVGHSAKYLAWKRQKLANGSKIGISVKWTSLEK